MQKKKGNRTKLLSRSETNWSSVVSCFTDNSFLLPWNILLKVEYISLKFMCWIYTTNNKLMCSVICCWIPLNFVKFYTYGNPVPCPRRKSTYTKQSDNYTQGKIINVCLPNLRKLIVFAVLKFIVLGYLFSPLFSHFSIFWCLRWFGNIALLTPLETILGQFSCCFNDDLTFQRESAAGCQFMLECTNLFLKKS